jgi:hypothetical protein
VPEKLEIPFSAVRGFYDPSVNFELEFDVKTEGVEDEAAAPAPEPIAVVPEKKAETKKKAAESEKKPAVADTGGKGADVVSLDAFRKK